MKNQTKAILCQLPATDPFGALSMPVYHTAAYEFANADTMSDAFCGRMLMPDYSRVMNPTVTFLEDKVRSITGAHNVVALNSGMSAIFNTLASVVESGQNIVTSRHLFGNTFSLITRTMRRWGIEARCVNLLSADAVEQAINSNTACIFLEVLTNPQLEVANLQLLADIAHKHGIPLIADTTAIPFTEFSSHKLGVDVEILSSTKYLSGGGTSVGGIVIDYGTFPQIGTRIKTEMLFNIGCYMTPHVAYMQTLGLETLDARYRVQSSNAQAVAEALRQSGLMKVNYVGFADNPFHDLAKQQFNNSYGAMFTIDLDNRQACYNFINKLQLVHRATNLFDNRSLAIHPASTIFGNYSADELASMDVLDTTIRLSIGLEAADDIIADLLRAAE